MESHIWLAHVAHRIDQTPDRATALLHELAQANPARADWLLCEGAHSLHDLVTDVATEEGMDVRVRGALQVLACGTVATVAQRGELPDLDVMLSLARSLGPVFALA